MRPEDMMALCSNCHHLVTAGAVSEEEQRQLKNSPINVVNGLAEGILYSNETRLEVTFGGGLAINTPVLIQASGGREIVKIWRGHDSRILVDAEIQDSNGAMIAQVSENEWISDAETVWDCEAYPQRVIIRSEQRRIDFEIDCRRSPIEVRGKWYLDGVRIEFSPTRCLVGTTELTVLTVENCGAFIVLS